MSKEPDWIRGLFNVDNFSGGSSLARGYSESVDVAFTRFGEMAVRLEDEGELRIDFPGLGVYTIYMADGELGFVCLELSTLLGNIEIDDLDRMAMKGMEILDIVRLLKESNQELYLSVYRQTGDVVVALESNEGTVDSSEDECEDFSSGYGGDISLGTSKICYHVIDLPDEFRVSVGERDGERRSLIPVSVAKSIDIRQFLRSRRTDRFVRLAQEVFSSY